MFDVAYWVARLNEEDGPEGMPSQFHLKEHWRYPQSLDILLPWSAHLEWRQNPANVMKGTDLHPKDHSIQIITDASNKGWDAHLEQVCTKGLWSDRSGPEKVQRPVPKPNSVGCYRQLNSSSLHKQTRRNPLGKDVCSPVEIHDLVPSLPYNS